MKFCHIHSDITFFIVGVVELGSLSLPSNSFELSIYIVPHNSVLTTKDEFKKKKI